MAEKIKLVQGDTRPQLVLSLQDSTTGAPIDISSATTRLKFRALGSTTILATMTASPIPGYVTEDGSISFAGPYANSGAGGRAVVNWTADALNNEAGDYEGEIEITFADTTVQTVYDTLKFKLRSQF
jgi:hypothetical protein